jgi:outer membrane protein
MKLKSLALATTVAIGALSAGSVFAYEAGDIIVRAGVATVAPDESSDGIAVPALAGVGSYDGSAIAGTGAEVDDNTQLGLTATYMLSDSLGIELLAATPFKHDITANLGGLGKVDAGETTHLPPTVSVVWYPLGSQGQFSPYVGAGLNYTIFFEEDVSADLEAGLSSVADVVTGVSVGLPSPVPLDLDLDDSFGVAVQLGADFALNEKWHINASVRWIDINTDAEFSSPGLGTVITVDDVEIDPWVYQVNIGYKF